MEILGLILYLLFVFFTITTKLVIGKKIIKNIFIKIIISLVLFPLIGLSFWCTAWIMGWIAKVILAPFGGIF